MGFCKSLLILLIVWSCGTTNNYRYNLTPYLLLFNQLAAQYKPKIYVPLNKIKVALQDEGANGTCYPYLNTVIISRSLWERYPDNTHRILITLHELGHCILRRPHRFDLFSNGCPKSIMHGNYFGMTDKQFIACFKANKEYYYKELMTWDAFIALPVP